MNMLYLELKEKIKRIEYLCSLHSFDSSGVMKVVRHPETRIWTVLCFNSGCRPGIWFKAETLGDLYNKVINEFGLADVLEDWEWY